MTANDWVLQGLADILGAPVDRPKVLRDHRARAPRGLPGCSAGAVSRAGRVRAQLGARPPVRAGDGRGAARGTLRGLAGRGAADAERPTLGRRAMMIPARRRIRGSVLAILRRACRAEPAFAGAGRAFRRPCCASISVEPSPLHVLRDLRGQERGVACATDRGDRILPGRQCARLVAARRSLSRTSRCPVPARRSSSRSRRICSGTSQGPPQCRRLPPRSPVRRQDRDTAWHGWERSELARRMRLNLHPCNWFLLAKGRQGIGNATGPIGRSLPGSSTPIVGATVDV